jgi:hypothetical protein
MASGGLELSALRRSLPGEDWYVNRGILAGKRLGEDSDPILPVKEMETLGRAQTLVDQIYLVNQEQRQLGLNKVTDRWVWVVNLAQKWCQRVSEMAVKGTVQR